MKKLGTFLLLMVLVCPVFSQLTSYPLPVGISMQGSDIVTFQDALYTVVYAGPVEGSKLCKFDGVGFTQIPNPLDWHVVAYRSPLKVFQDNLYMLVTDFDDDPTIPPAPMLFRFDGTNFTRIMLPFSQAPSTRALFDLEIYHDKLYIPVAPDEYTAPNAWVTYDGTSFTMINFPTGMRDSGIAGMTVYNDQLFTLMESTPGGATTLTSYDGTAFHTHTVPDLVRTKTGIYNGKLMLTQSTGSTTQLVAYDGTTTTAIPTPSSVRPIASGKELYGSLLYLRMADAATASNLLMAYNGGTFSRVATLPGMAIEDFEVWGGGLYFASSGALHRYHPLVLGPYYDFSHIDIDLFAHERGWCWNEIVIDWDIHPICLTPPLCPPFGEYPIDLRLMDKTKVVWESIEKKPTTLQIPVEDKPYTFSLASGKTKKPEQFVTIDPNLVNLGLETLKLSFSPRDNKAAITLAAKKDRQVSVTLTFLNADDVPVWQETVTAPVEKQFEIKTKIPGTKWLISPGGKTLEAAGITSLTYYPNPFDGKITVKAETKGQKVPVQISIDNMMGKRVAEGKLSAPGEQTIELKDKIPGLYVLTFATCHVVKKVLIELKE
jgi:hypothetical protein